MSDARKLVSIEGQGYSKVNGRAEVTTYQTIFVGIRVLPQILGQGPVRHTVVYNREWRVIGAESKETDHVWMP